MRSWIMSTIQETRLTHSPSSMLVFMSSYVICSQEWLLFPVCTGGLKPADPLDDVVLTWPNWLLPKLSEWEIVPSLQKAQYPPFECAIFKHPVKMVISDALANFQQILVTRLRSASVAWPFNHMTPSADLETPHADLTFVCPYYHTGVQVSLVLVVTFSNATVSHWPVSASIIPVCGALSTWPVLISGGEHCEELSWMH